MSLVRYSCYCWLFCCWEKTYLRSLPNRQNPSSRIANCFCSMKMRYSIWKSSQIYWNSIYPSALHFHWNHCFDDLLLRNAWNMDGTMKMLVFVYRNTQSYFYHPILFRYSHYARQFQPFSRWIPLSSCLVQLQPQVRLWVTSFLAADIKCITIDLDA